MTTGARRHAPATERNREPIAAVLRQELPETGLVLEVASGTGEHAVYFAERFPALTWQPSDADQMARASITAWAVQAKLNNVRPPLDLDAEAAQWPITHADAILCINMVHISPWEATLGLLANGARILAPGAPLILYGPYFRDAVDTAPSNLAFDIDLRDRNPEWGLRHLEVVDHEAMAQGLEPYRLVDMPANNIMRVYRRRPLP
ncbi:MAG TPA: DUF938 domain-containing protein [Sphingobium sp.]|uniref:DUF938 domain-containing protein n=1 Tax=Sphingobium sp. TaxID=1912891 RepID=UPI002ED51678